MLGPPSTTGIPHVPSRPPSPAPQGTRRRHGRRALPGRHRRLCRRHRGDQHLGPGAGRRQRPLPHQVPRGQRRAHQPRRAGPRPPRRRHGDPARQGAGLAEGAPHRHRCRGPADGPQARPRRCRGADAPARRRPGGGVRRGRPEDVPGAEPERHLLQQPPVALLRVHRRHPRRPGLGPDQRRRHRGGGAGHRHHQPQRPQRQHPARLRLHQRCHRGRRRQRPRLRPHRPG